MADNSKECAKNAAKKKSHQINVADKAASLSFGSQTLPFGLSIYILVPDRYKII